MQRRGSIRVSYGNCSLGSGLTTLDIQSLLIGWQVLCAKLRRLDNLFLPSKPLVGTLIQHINRTCHRQHSSDMANIHCDLDLVVRMVSSLRWHENLPSLLRELYRSRRDSVGPLRERLIHGTGASIIKVALTCPLSINRHRLQK